VLALIVVLPADSAVTIAVVSLIDATLVFELAHLIGTPRTVAPVESIGVAVACVRCPTRNCEDARLTSNTRMFRGLVVIASEWQANTTRTIRNLTTPQRDVFSALLIDSGITTLCRRRRKPKHTDQHGQHRPAK
jgi:hypothetical protein